MDSSGDEDNDSMSQNHSDTVVESIFFVENFYMDLSQFHVLGESQPDQPGWTESDASKQIEGTEITEDLIVEAFNVQNAESGWGLAHRIKLGGATEKNVLFFSSPARSSIFVAPNKFFLYHFFSVFNF